MARLNMIFLSICWATLSATKLASNSGFLISCTLTRAILPAIADTSALRRSMSSPFLPITMPGLAVWIITLISLGGRSI